MQYNNNDVCMYVILLGIIGINWRKKGIYKEVGLINKLINLKKILKRKWVY